MRYQPVFDTSSSCPIVIMLFSLMHYHSENFEFFLGAKWLDTVPGAGHLAVNNIMSLLSWYFHSVYTGVWWGMTGTQEYKRCHLLITAMKSKTRQGPGWVMGIMSLPPSMEISRFWSALFWEVENIIYEHAYRKSEVGRHMIWIKCFVSVS